MSTNITNNFYLSGPGELKNIKADYDLMQAIAGTKKDEWQPVLSLVVEYKPGGGYALRADWLPGFDDKIGVASILQNYVNELIGNELDANP